jgi:hypothetical protein
MLFTNVTDVERTLCNKTKCPEKDIPIDLITYSF